MFYILKCDKFAENDGHPARVRLIGPFDDADKACHWAEYREAPDTNPNNSEDNPMWQLVDLAEPTVAVVAPADADDALS